LQKLPFFGDYIFGSYSHYTIQKCNSGKRAILNGIALLSDNLSIGYPKISKHLGFKTLKNKRLAKSQRTNGQPNITVQTACQYKTIGYPKISKQHIFKS
jgi:hypothetical protein